ncbi:MAG: hypothetical protein NVSMB31_06220 [Vulcanimicrobiaceae bacterium]
MTPEQLVAFAEGLSRIAAAGGGPKAFANHLAHELGATVLIEDAEHKHLATGGGGATLPVSIRDVLDSRAASPGTVWQMTNGHPGVAMALYAGQAHLGWLAIFGGGLTEHELGLRLAASAIGLELSRERGGQRGRLRSFWERLIAGTFHDAESARDVATSHGITLATNYVAIALEIETSEDSNDRPGYAEMRGIASEAFHCSAPEAGILEAGNSLKLILPAAREIDVANIRTAALLFPRTLAKRLPDIRIAGGVGDRAGLLCLPRSMDQANNALTIGRRMFGIGRVAMYDDLGIYPLLFEAASSDAWREFSQRALAPLRAYDEKHQTELERTLALYFSVGENVKTAAAQLNVHRHTVFYRLRQIADICRSKLESPHDQLTLRLAIAIDALFK